MASKNNPLTSSVFRKYLMGATGLALLGFVLTHLLGNLLLFQSTGDAFNSYSQSLADWGALLYFAEIGLLAVFVIHVAVAIVLTRSARAARPVRYAMLQSKKGKSHSGLSSNNMIITGLLLLVFVVAHIIHFKFGPGLAEGYATAVKGREIRDLYRLVVESFHNPLIVTGYVCGMLILGVHLRHGFWSALQSLGAMNDRHSRCVYCVSLGLSIVLAGGFLLIPVWIYFDLSQKFFGQA